MLFRKSFCIPVNSSVYPTLSCTNFKVLGLILRPLIYFKLILIQCERQVSSFTFLHADWHFVKTQVGILCESISGSSILFH
jgi:hypothetical protein